MYWFFPENYGFSFRTLRAIGNCHYGQGEFGEIAQVIERIKNDDYNSWCEEWKRMGDKCMDEGADAEKKGNMYTSCFAYNRATSYYHLSQFFLPYDDPQKLPLYFNVLKCFEKGTRLDKPCPERVQIPYENSYLFAYFVPSESVAEGEKPPCVVWFGGLDSTAEEVYYCIAKDLARRGMSVLLVDGPGQGASIRLNHIHSRYDYEVAGTAAFDYLVTRSDVDLDRVGLMAWSMGGYYAPRIACFEPRYHALVTYGAIFDYGEVWNARPDNHPMIPYIKWIFNKKTIEEARAEVARCNFRGGELSNIKCPVLICHCDADQQQASRDNAQRLIDGMVNSSDRTFHIFTREEGGCEHVSGDNMSHANAIAGDWFRKIFNIK